MDKEETGYLPVSSLSAQLLQQGNAGGKRVAAGLFYTVSDREHLSEIGISNSIEHSWNPAAL